MAGDFNAKSYLWGSSIEDARGTLLADLTAALDMFACNAGASPTFVRGQSKSHIDVTFASSRIRGTVNNWMVSDEEALSLHRYINFEVGTYISTMTQPCHGWASNKIEASLLRVTLSRLVDPTPETAAARTEEDSFVEWMTQAADSCLPKRMHDNGRRSAYGGASTSAYSEESA